MGSNQNCLFNLQDVSYGYPGASEKSLDNVSINILNNKITGIMGPNGSGKTTLFRIITNQITDYQGDFSIHGFDEKNYLTKVGVTFQQPSLDKILTVKENLLIHSSLYGLNKKIAVEKINQLAKLVEVDDRLNDKVKTLSGGLARRVELIKILLHDPQLLILDEPTSSLDPDARKKFWDVIFKIKSTNKNISIVLITHLMEEAKSCDELIFLQKGKLIAAGSPSELCKPMGEYLVTVNVARKSDNSDLKSYSQFLYNKGSEYFFTVKNPQEFIASLASKFDHASFQSVKWNKPSMKDFFIWQSNIKAGE